MKILTATQMGEVDRLTTEIYRIPALLLMESAGRSFADELGKLFPKLSGMRVFVVCGRGNNGGDGLVIARYLSLRGGTPEVFFIGDPEKLSGDPLTNWNIVQALKIHVKVFHTGDEFRQAAGSFRSPDVVVDALFGTGLGKPIGPDLAQVVHWTAAVSDRAFVASVDIPSGIFADSPEIPGPAVQADLTVTFSAPKLAHILPPASNYAGRVVVVPIGSPSELFQNPGYRMNWIDGDLIQKVLPPRARDAHKGTYGHVYVLAGSRGKSGAALMTGMAALRSGAGLVTIWMPESLQHDIVGKFPELMTEYLPETPEGTSDLSGLEKLVAALPRADALIVGPGMTTNAATQQLIRQAVRLSPVPVVLDADGLNAFSPGGERIHNEAGHPVVLTPHPGEMARLAGLSIGEVQNNRIGTACAFAAEHKVLMVLKGNQTIVCSPSGDIYINTTGNPGMATAGSGDILSGILGRFVAGWARNRSKSALPLSEYVAAATYLHGLAGDLAAEEQGEESMTATDILPHLPQAFRSVRAGRKPEGRRT
jgi:hydroxyethylthiazole kinase-like uncharacterized protein yjeF